MKITISDSYTLHEIQEKFSLIFPYLKIEFFSKPHNIYGSSRKEFIIHPDTQLKDCRSKQLEGQLEIDGNLSVAKMEQQFRHMFGLFIQVFRKSGDVWIETTVTDDWTLNKQNSEAESFYNDMKTRRQINLSTNTMDIEPSF
jgi:hypothetical protein